mmetsp:Transcript_14086/g.40243  ORF Transcript_14086/g.40243 Transcript_14086/m.40243 type:complete len:262 (+) Transcript_14086:90-875(+)
MIGPWSLVHTAALVLSLAIPNLPHASSFKIIGAGFPKTGCNALAEALDMLGFHTYHAGQWHRAHGEKWISMLRSGASQSLYEMADELVARGFDAALDTPIASFTLTLMEHFPRAKVILMHRDMDAWFESFLEQGKRMVVLHSWGLVTDSNMELMELTNRRLYNCSSHPPGPADKAGAVSAHRQHVASIRGRVPADQLLEFGFAQGWGPMCRFLDLPAPDGPFPNPWHSRSSSYRALALLPAAGATACLLCATARWRRARPR